MKRIDRRESLVGLASVLIAPAALLACGKKPLECTDTSALKPDELSLRATLAYTDTSADPTKHCADCQLYKPAAPDQCGGCQLIKGPINPKGSCKSWVKKT
jgi:hypothetical protein